MISSRRTWQGSIRVSRLRLEHIRRRALEEGWQLSELVRVFICLGAAVYFLRLRNPEALERFTKLARTSEASRALDMAVGRPRGRRNEPRHIGKTTRLPMDLPKGLYTIISAYSAAIGLSRNAQLSRFLEAGYIVYMLSQETVLKILSSLPDDRTRSPEKSA